MSSDNTPPTPYNRFEELASKLLKVPKSEIASKPPKKPRKRKAKQKAAPK